MKLPYLVFADIKGKVYSHPYLRMAVADMDDFSLPQENSFIALPTGSNIFYLPGRRPVGFNPDTGSFESFDYFDGKEAFAAAAFLIPAYLRLHNPASIVKKKVVLPLWAYTACGFHSGKFIVTATRIDARRHQEPHFYNCKKVKAAVNIFEKKFRDNRLYRHLANCAVNYNCLNAKNLFLRRWEAGIPTSPVCNARCLGCISLQEECAVPASHQRLTFVPDAVEIAQVMTEHLKYGHKPMISFGQGCEGEPLLQSANIGEAVRITRGQTSRGVIHMNTNGSLPKQVEELCRAGVDSFRFSLNSAREENYNAYFRPRGYKFHDVLRSIFLAKKYKKFVAINLLTFPGVTDSKEEVNAWERFIKKTGIDMIQWRNLNIDPRYYFQHIPFPESKALGIVKVLDLFRRRFPKLKFGYFNHFS